MTTREERRLLANNQHGPVLKLELNQNTKRSAIAKALYQNKTVESVSIFIQEKFFVDVDPNNLHNLFRAIGSLPRLTSLTLYSYGEKIDVFPTTLLTDVVSVAAKLEVLTLFFLELGGTTVSFEPFEEAIRMHPCLREFKLENCRLGDFLLNSLTADRFVNTLSTLPNLERVELSASQMGYLGVITPRSLEIFAARTENLQSLSLINLVFDNDHICALSRALRHNKELTQLTMSVDPAYNTKLPALLATAEHLEYVKLIFPTLDNESFLIKIAKGLSKSESITRLELEGELSTRMSLKAQQAFVAVLDKRTDVEHLDVPITNRSLRKKVRLFLKLNNTGKRHIMRDPNSTRYEMVKALAHVRNDLDCLFYFLRMKPVLCEPPPPPEPIPEPEEDSLEDPFTIYW